MPVSPGTSIPSTFHTSSCPLGLRSAAAANIIPPGGRLGSPVAGAARNTGRGSSKMAVGWPLLIASTTLLNSSGPSDDGWTTSITSYISFSIGLVGSISSTSYCFSSSSTISCLGICCGRPPANEKPPNSCASVRTMPIFLRSFLATVQIERINSYSTGMP